MSENSVQNLLENSTTSLENIASHTNPKPDKAFQALARKYRPQNFSEMVGQNVLVTTLCNALKTGRMHHAFMLSGVRGTGKTTIARIIAKAVNCVGRDVQENPDPCGTCESCRAIANEANMDVVEIDAASHTGVNDMRDIIESVKYRPIAGGYKIYIIDEVHMLSKSAFNALLKTLEEPPDYVKFIFATTEIHKVPVTILSRCQHLELLRVEQKVLADYFSEIIKKENLSAPNLSAPIEALMMIALAADGSVRDGQSLLDQAISLAGQNEIDSALIANMLRLNDQTHIYRLLDDCFSTRPQDALNLLHQLYQKGGAPEMIVRDLLQATYWLTRLHLSPDLSGSIALPEYLRETAHSIAQKLDMPRLTRIWQILQQGAAELSHSPVKQQSVEMLMLKLCYAADLPDPSSLMNLLQNNQEALPSAPPQELSPPEQLSPELASSDSPSPIMAIDEDKKKTNIVANLEEETSNSDDIIDIAPEAIEPLEPVAPIEPPAPPEISPEAIQPEAIQSLTTQIIPEFQILITDITNAHEAMLGFNLTEQIICTAWNPPIIHLHATTDRVDKKDLTHRLTAFFKKHRPPHEWEIMWDEQNHNNFITLYAQQEILKNQEKDRLSQTDFVKQALQLFPNASIVNIETQTNQKIANQEMEPS